MFMGDPPFKSLSLEGPLVQNKEEIETFGDSALAPPILCTTSGKSRVDLGLFGLVGFYRTSWPREFKSFLHF